MDETWWRNVGWDAPASLITLIKATLANYWTLLSNANFSPLGSSLEVKFCRFCHPAKTSIETLHVLCSSLSSSCEQIKTTMKLIEVDKTMKRTGRWQLPNWRRSHWQLDFCKHVQRSSNNDSRLFYWDASFYCLIACANRADNCRHFMA